MCRSEKNIKKDLREVDCEVTDWIYLVHDRVQWQVLVNSAANLWVP
jgi:hypothetical protein